MVKEIQPDAIVDLSIHVEDVHILERFLVIAAEGYDHLMFTLTGDMSTSRSNLEFSRENINVPVIHFCVKPAERIELVPSVLSPEKKQESFVFNHVASSLSRSRVAESQ